jgi:hypothetical protein
MQSSTNARLANNSTLFCSEKQVREFNQEMCYFRIFSVNVKDGKVRAIFIDSIFSTHANVIKDAKEKIALIRFYNPATLVAECMEQDRLPHIYS